MKRSSITDVAGPPLIVLVGVCVVWETTVRTFQVPAYLLPGPLQIAQAAWSTRDQLITAMWLTAQAALCGLALSILIGTSIALAFSQSGFIRRGFYPYAIFLQTVPIVAIAPLVIIWFGHRFRSVVLISFVISVFPIITSATTGLMMVDGNLLDLFRLHRASRWQVLLKLRLPNSVPFLLTGVRIATGVTVIGAIVGEFFVGEGAKSPGLGYLMYQKQILMRTDELFAAVIGATVLGVVVFAVVTVVGNRILARWFDQPSE